MDRKYQRNQHVQSLHVLRVVARSIIDIGQSFAKDPKTVKDSDILSIPEIDKEIKKFKARKEREFDRRAEKVLQKYKKYSK